MKPKNPKDFWKKLNLQHFKFNKNELYNYFKGLSGTEPTDSHSSEKTRKNQTQDEFNNVENIEMLDILDRTISIDEIKKVITKLKNGKAAGIDRIIPELLKEFDDNILSIIALIVNKILDSSNFP